jgi:hypothetical protein
MKMRRSNAPGGRPAAGDVPLPGVAAGFWASPRRRWAAGLTLALALSAAYTSLAIARVRGDMLNSYPVATMDGLDWLFEGHAVAALLAGNARIDLPLVRNPVYVLCIAADAALGGGGRFLLGMHAAAFFLQAVLLFAACELLGTDLRLQLATPLLLAASALGAYRFAVYPEDLALVFLLASLLALLLWRRTGRPAWLAAAGLATVLGALTQEYAAVPLLAAALFYTARAWRRRQRLPWGLLATCAVAGLACAAAIHAWKAAVPHRYERDLWAPFTNRDNSYPFILRTNLALWLHTFWPLAGVLAAGIANLWDLRVLRRLRPLPRPAGLADPADPADGRRLESPRPEAAGLMATVVAAFALLILAYRWPDARFTYMLTPVVVLLSCAMLPRDAAWPARDTARLGQQTTRVAGWRRWRQWPRWLASPWLALLLWVAQGAGLARPFDSWVGPAARVSLPAVLRFPVLDRFELRSRCGSAAAFCPQAGVAKSAAPYDRVILCEYRSLKIDGFVGGCGGLDDVTNFIPAPAPEAARGPRAGRRSRSPR